MNTVLLYAVRSFLSLMVALVCSAEARAGSFGREPAPIVASAPQTTHGLIVSYRIENLRVLRL